MQMAETTDDEKNNTKIMVWYSEFDLRFRRFILNAALGLLR